MLQLTPNLLMVTVNWWKRVSLKFVSTSAVLKWHGWLFKDTHFIDPLELEASNLPKLLIIETITNPIKFFE